MTRITRMFWVIGLRYLEIYQKTGIIAVVLSYLSDKWGLFSGRHNTTLQLVRVDKVSFNYHQYPCLKPSNSIRGLDTVLHMPPYANKGKTQLVIAGITLLHNSTFIL